MPTHTVNWVNDHTQICDCLNERIQLMQNYLDSKYLDIFWIALYLHETSNRQLLTRYFDWS